MNRGGKIFVGAAVFTAIATLVGASVASADESEEEITKPPDLKPPPNPFPDSIPAPDREPETPIAPVPPKPEPPKPEPPKPAPKPAPAESSAAQLGIEAHNAAIVVLEGVKYRDATVRGRKFSTTAKPGTADYRKAIVYWLTDVVLYATYPESPTVLSATDKAQARYREAWVRLRSYVDRGLALAPQLGAHPVLGGEANKTANDNWRRWALAVAYRSTVRTVPALREAYKKAWFWIFKDPKGREWLQSNLGKMVQGERAEADGLLGESAVLLTGRSWPDALRLLEAWPQTVTKSYTATNGITGKATI